MTKARSLAAAVTVASATALALAVSVPASAETTTFAPNVAPIAVNSLTSGGLTAAQAGHRLAVQRGNASHAHAVAAALGSAAAGTYLDRLGNPVVDVLSPAAADQVRAAGATPKLVAHSSAALAAVQRSLDALPATPNSSWGVDPVSNQVVVRISDAAPKPAADRLRAAVARFGDRARVVGTHGAITTQVLDGDEISTGSIICSAGFNASRGGQAVIIDAGHCTAGSPSWQGIGPSLDSSFPGTDYGLIENDSGDGPGAGDTYDGGQQAISGAGDATVGEQVCKSGRTTQVTCGSVQALDQTVDYGSGDVVNGLIQTDVYSDHGDSGGPLYDGSTGLGTVSGGDSTTDYFQPLPAALSAYGASLV